MTLLAKALYDNLADAPDELSFRRGDIVTVIEQDVDGLLGWWLCLLHGRQGIVPGNRLQVIPPVELDQLEKSKVQGGLQRARGSYSTDEFSDGPDGYGDQHCYDVLPIPIKAQASGQQPPPLTIKDMFTIPSESPRSSGQDTSNVSTITGTNARDGPSVVPSNVEPQNVPAQKYPVFVGRSLSESSQPVYDEIPGTGDIYDEIPERSAEIYDVPTVQKFSARKSATIGASPRLYQSPKSSQEMVATRANELVKAPGVPVNSKTKRMWTPASEQLITSMHAGKVVESALDSSAEVYDTPPNQVSQEQVGAKKPVTDSAGPKQIGAAVPGSKQAGLGLAGSNQGGPDLAGSKRLVNDRLGAKQAGAGLLGPKDVGTGDLGSPSHGGTDVAGPKPNVSTLVGLDRFGPKQGAPSLIESHAGPSLSGVVQTGPTQSGSKIVLTEQAGPKLTSTEPIGQKQVGLIEEEALGTVIASSAMSQSEVNKNFLHDFYNKPSSYSASLPRRPTTQSSSQEQEVYDVPKQAKSSNLGNHRLKDVYNAPTLPRASTVVVQNEEVYDVPSSSRMASNAQDEEVEVYDVPAGRSRPVVQDVYDVPPSRTVGQPTGQDIYDTPKETPPASEFYDTPSFKPALKSESSTVPARASQDAYYRPGTNTLKRSLKANVREFQTMKETTIGGPDELYDVPANHDLNKVMADVTAAYSSHPRAQRNFLVPANMYDDDDYVDYHDIWTAEPPKNLVQDVKDIGKSRSRSPSPGRFQKRPTEPKKSILDQINFDNVKELPLSVTQALERLGKLHLAVDTCVQTLLNFRFDGWLDVASLTLNIGAIRDFSGKLKTALRLMTEFGLGTLVNSTKHPEGESLMESLIGEVEPLLECYYKVKICLMHLDSTNWVIPSSPSSGSDKFFATLNAIMILSQLIPDKCSSFNLFLQKNISDLFEDSASTDMKQRNARVSVENDSRLVSSPRATRGRSPERKVPAGDAKGKLKPIDPKQIREFLEIDNRESKGLPSNFASEKHPEAEMSAATLRRELAGRRQQARDSAAMGTLRPGPRVPPKPTLPSHRRSLAGILDPEQANVVASAVPVDRLVTEFVPDSARKKYASDPARSPAGKDASRPGLGGSCPTLLERNSLAVGDYSQEATSRAYSTETSVSQEQIDAQEAVGTSDTNSRGGKNFPSDSNLLLPSSPGNLHQRSASLPFGDRANLFAFDHVARQRIDSQVSALDHRDIESLEFFCRQVESQAMTLREAMRNLTESVENREEPEVFVSHSKFVILTAHKVVHAGQEIAERLLNQDVKAKIKDGTGHLTSCIRAVVSATKAAALEFPDASALMEMISSVLAIGDGVRVIHSECRRALDS